jgi:hypothetical protein
MLRQALGRSAWRSGRQAILASRTLSTTPQRNAEVELTIGGIPSPLAGQLGSLDGKLLIVDGKKVSIEGKRQVTSSMADRY